MAKEFKKGQAVVHFGSYDRRGTWFFTRAIVGSCGVKQMTLINAETDVNMGCHFAPNSNKTASFVWQGKEVVHQRESFTLADMTDEEAHAICIERATDQNATLAASYIAKRDDVTSERGYSAAMAKALAELHEPRSIKR